MTYTVSRRSFLGASLAAIPGLGLAARLAGSWIKEAEFVVSFHSLPPVTITTFPNGSIIAAWQERVMQVAEDRGWKKLSAKVGDTTLEMRVRRPGVRECDVDWFFARSPDFVAIEDYCVPMSGERQQIWGDVVGFSSFDSYIKLHGVNG